MLASLPAPVLVYPACGFMLTNGLPKWVQNRGGQCWFNGGHDFCLVEALKQQDHGPFQLLITILAMLLRALHF